MRSKRSVIAIVLCLFIGCLIAIAGSTESVQAGSIPLFALCALVIFIIHWIIFIPSYIYRTEHYFDVTGSISFLSAIVCAWILTPEKNDRNIFLSLLVAVWAVRLGSFLFRRVTKAGKDDRFDRLKRDFLTFAMVWTLSALWVLLTVSAVLAALTSAKTVELGWFTVVGSAMWCAGFVIEVAADVQKSKFRSKPENNEKFISHGLWAYSRHPNYFGEITLWFGMAVIAFPVLSGWQYATLVSPFFVYFLLVKVSGIPLLERKAAKRWADDEEYSAYLKRTRRLLPLSRQSS
jgi:steroid 5-alpha reductase family enzyme